jgi:hypothetical protein
MRLRGRAWRLVALVVVAFSVFAGAALADGPVTFVRHFGSGGGSAGQLNGAAGLAVDPSTGNVLVADADNDRIDEFDSSGAFVNAWGWGVIPGQTAAFQTCTQASGCQAGSANGGEGDGTLASPFGVAVGPLRRCVRGRVQQPADLGVRPLEQHGEVPARLGVGRGRPAAAV